MVGTSEKIFKAMGSYRAKNNLLPNKLVIGYKMIDRLRREILHFNHPVDKLEDLRLKVKYEFYGVPVEVDYDNPDTLKVGYMVDYTSDIYEY